MRTCPPVEDVNESTSPLTERAALHGARPAAEARLLAWVEGLLATGLCRQVPDGRFTLACSQAELARRLGLSPTSGSISKRFTALERMGVLVCRDPILFDLTVSSQRHPAPPARSQGHTPAASSGATPAVTDPPPQVDRLAVLVDLLHRVVALERTDLLDRVLETLAGTLALPGATHVEERSCFITRAPSAPPVPPRFPFPSPSDDSSAFSLSSSLSSSLPSSLPSAQSSPLPGVAPRPELVFPGRVPHRDDMPRAGRYRFRRSQDAAARLQALAPLLEDCARRGLPGVGSPTGLLEAFDGYTLEQINRGVEFVRSQLATSSPLRFPVGLLAHMARTGDLALVEHVPSVASIDADLPREVRGCIPSQEPPGEWLARMGALMRTGEPGV